MAGRWFSSGTLVASTTKTDHHDITEVWLKVALNTISPIPPIRLMMMKDKRQNMNTNTNLGHHGNISICVHLGP